MISVRIAFVFASLLIIQNLANEEIFADPVGKLKAVFRKANDIFPHGRDCDDKELFSFSRSSTQEARQINQQIIKAYIEKHKMKKAFKKIDDILSQDKFNNKFY